MLARLVFGLVLGLLMYIPRPIPRDPNTLPPRDPDTMPPGSPDVLPELPSGPEELPPTPPPGHEGAWPPNSAEGRGLPPTPPPGYEGEWPAPGAEGGGDPELISIRDQLRDLLRQVRGLLRRDPGIALPPPEATATRGPELLSAGESVDPGFYRGA